MSLAFSSPSVSARQESVVRIERQKHSAACVLASQTKVLLPPFLALHVDIGDEITFPSTWANGAGTEICLTKKFGPGGNRCLYLEPIGYVSRPKEDKRKQYFVSAEIRQGKLGVSTILLPCEILREYFYRFPQINGPSRQPTLYEILRVAGDVSASQLRVAFKLRDLELKAAGAPQGERGSGASIQYPRSS
jgi:hypothetical protein